MTPTSNEAPPTRPSRLRLFGVPIRIHFTFVLFIVFVLFVEAGSKASAVSNIIFLAALFGSVILHELGHALVARRHGIKTLEMVMYPIGGVSRLEKSPPAKDEFWIAFAGPLVNFAIAGALYGYLAFTNHSLKLTNLNPPTDENLPFRICFANLVLGAFNLLPAFPMDGGRILRAWLAQSRPEEVATRIAATWGRYLAIALGLVGLLSGNFLLMFVAFFVYLGATSEEVTVLNRTLTQGVPVSAAMITDFRTLEHGNTIGDAANLLLATSQHDFPVMLGQQVIGLLHRSALFRAMASEGKEAYVAGAMDREFVSLAPNMDLGQALPLLTQSGGCALVIDDERLVGMLTAENLNEFLLLRQVGMGPAAVRA